MLYLILISRLCGCKKPPQAFMHLNTHMKLTVCVCSFHSSQQRTMWCAAVARARAEGLMHVEQCPELQMVCACGMTGCLQTTQQQFPGHCISAGHCVCLFHLRPINCASSACNLTGLLITVRHMLQLILILSPCHSCSCGAAPQAIGCQLGPASFHEEHHHHLCQQWFGLCFVLTSCISSCAELNIMGQQVVCCMYSQQIGAGSMSAYAKLSCCGAAGSHYQASGQCGGDNCDRCMQHSTYTGW